MNEEALLQFAAAMGIPVDRALVPELLDEVERVIAAAQRLRELPIDLEASPRSADPDERP